MSEPIIIFDEILDKNFPWAENRSTWTVPNDGTYHINGTIHTLEKGETVFLGDKGDV